MQKAIVSYDKGIGILTKVCAYVGISAMFFVVLLTVTHGTGRYIFNKPVLGMVEITNFMVISAVFLTFAYTLKLNGHTSIRVIIDRLSERGQAICGAVSSVIGIIFSVGACWQTLMQCKEVVGAVSVILHLPKVPFFYVIAVGWGLFTLTLILLLAKDLSKLMGGKWILSLILLTLAASAALILFTHSGRGVLGDMNQLAVGLIGLLVISILLFSGIPVAIVLAAGGFFGVALFAGFQPANCAIATIPYATLYNYAWSSIPMYILMGFFADHSGLAKDFYTGVQKWVGHFRGGLAQAVIVANAAFGACSGNSLSAAITFCSISLPEMRKYRYDDKITLGAICGGSLLSSLIPPSIVLIIFGAVTQTQISDLFIGGIIPGLLLSVMFMIQIYVQCRINPFVGPAMPPSPISERLRATTGMWTVVAVFGIIIGGIYFGLFTPTEAGAFGAFVVLLIGLIRRKLGWGDFKDSLLQSAITLGMVGFLFVAALVFNLFIVRTGVPVALSELVSNVSSPPLFMMLVVLLYIILGLFLDGLAILMLTLPVLFPLATQLGIDPVHFCIVISTANLIGALTPPFGMVVYSLATVAKDVPIMKIFAGSVPFVLTTLACNVVLIFFPQLSTFLPSTMAS